MYRCLSGNEYSFFEENSEFNPQAPVAQKIVDELVFRPHWPHLRFSMRIFWKIQKILSFFSGYKSRSCFESDGFIAYSNEWDWREKKTMFIHNNQPFIKSFYIKKVPITTGALGGKPIRRVRVKPYSKKFIIRKNILIQKIFVSFSRSKTYTKNLR